jgi:hypothetical protein
MKLKNYFILWIAIILLLTYENLMLNSQPKEGFLGLFQSLFPSLKNLNLSPEPGRTVSLFLGWTGFASILVTNFYILRKRFGFMKKFGKMSGWLDFHIFCGLLGPTLVVFHTNFKVRGLVSISFWSMIVVAVSGIVGRYFYGQVSQVKTDLEKDVKAQESVLKQYIQRANLPYAEALEEQIKEQALTYAGGDALLHPEKTGLIDVFVSTVAGDTKMMFMAPKAVPGLPDLTRGVLKRYAVAKRRVVFYDTFNKYLGYWHSFHLPFAIFMYIVAVIHIISALLFGV